MSTSENPPATPPAAQPSPKLPPTASESPTNPKGGTKKKTKKKPVAIEEEPQEKEPDPTTVPQQNISSSNIVFAAIALLSIGGIAGYCLTKNYSAQQPVAHEQSSSRPAQQGPNNDVPAWRTQLDKLKKGADKK